MYYHPFYNVDPFEPKSLEFDILTSEAIKKLSVAKISTYITFNKLGYPSFGSLYDPKLGPIKQSNDPCVTCGRSALKCMGHYGHIELPLPVIHPIFMTIICNILKVSCQNCHVILIPPTEKYVLLGQLKLIEAGHIVEAYELASLLPEYSCLLPKHVKQRVDIFCDNVFKSSEGNMFCKNIEESRREYINDLFKMGSHKKNCFNCNKRIAKISVYQNKIMIDKTSKGEKKSKGEKWKKFLTPLDIKEHMRNVWKNDKDFLSMILKVFHDSTNEYPTDSCFLTDVPVTPSNTRPVRFVNNKPVEHSKNNIYKSILQDCLLIRSIMKVMNIGVANEELSKELLDVVKNSKGESNNEKMHIAWQTLQINVITLLDTDVLKLSRPMDAYKIGIKQLIEKKQGILRKNMMGKRVDYFARTVITPDPLLDIDEIGVPKIIAKKLTYPVPVTSWNVTDLRKLVINGPNKHPGATVIESDNGNITWISPSNLNARKGLAKTLLTPGVDSQGPKIVHRHLVNGDVLLMNRQPSLHRPSIMAHKTRILNDEKTFRLHYANCKAYNADFDGDEMNAHFVQNELSRSEAILLANVPNQYLVPRDGSPLSGLIQDHIISGVKLSIRGKFFTRSEYHQLIFQALCFLTNDIKLLPPAILKPCLLWSGKQIISTVIINLCPQTKSLVNLESDAKISFKSCVDNVESCANVVSINNDKYMSESKVILRSGQLLCGILDKNHLGSTHYGLIHSFYELYGAKHCSQLLTAFSKLFTYSLHKDGFTLGVEDILLKNKPEARRQQIVKKTKCMGREAATKVLGIELDVEPEILQHKLERAYKKHPNFQSHIDRQYKSILDKHMNEINKICLPKGLIKPFPRNNLQLMVQSGAKGSTVNTMQISCLLGQIELEGKRPPLMISGRSLPSYTPYNVLPEASGFITSRFMTGLQPQEFFFHCMAGREGLIDTAVKTSRSGYLQRCLVKHLESLTVNYDLTVRDSDNSVIQFMYGEDGQDITKLQLLKPEQFPFIAENIGSIYDKKKIKALKKSTDEQSLNTAKMQINNLKCGGEITNKIRCNGFLKFCTDMKNHANDDNTDYKIAGRSTVAAKLCKLWLAQDKKIKTRYNIHNQKHMDPVLFDFHPDVHFGSVSEALEKMLDNYFKNLKQEIRVKESQFRDAVYLRSMQALCHPGESVGMLAAQSVGEPSTQMTLNTFHFAGRGEMNVTLGIPRLREIIMCASEYIKTPSMEIPFKSNVRKLKKKADKLRKSLNTLLLKDVLESITVKESMHLEDNHHHIRYMLNMKFLPHSLFSDVTDITPKKVMRYIHRKFLRKLEEVFQKNLRLSYTTELINASNKKTVKTKNGKKIENENENFFDENPTKDSSQNVRFHVTISDDSDNDSVIAEADKDATENKLRNRRTDANDYDDDDDGEDIEKTNNINTGSDESFIGSDIEDGEKHGTQNESDSGIAENTDDKLSDNPLPKKNRKVSGEQKKKSSEQLGIGDFEYDEENYSWCKILIWTSLAYKKIDLTKLLPDLVSKSVIYEVSGIKRAITYDDMGTLTLKTEGSYGISELFWHGDILDLNKLYSNDIYAISKTYGIEAANRVLIREIQNVFNVYGITVDPRHLSLIADYMTFDGTYRPLNKTGMDTSSSPLQQMTFESTLRYLKNSTIRNLRDNLRSLSSSLMIGKECKIGSGLIKLLHK